MQTTVFTESDGRGILRTLYKKRLVGIQIVIIIQRRESIIVEPVKNGDRRREIQIVDIEEARIRIAYHIPSLAVLVLRRVGGQRYSYIVISENLLLVLRIHCLEMQGGLVVVFCILIIYSSKKRYQVALISMQHLVSGKLAPVVRTASVGR